MTTTRRTYLLAVATLMMLAACSATGGSSPESSPSASEESEHPATSSPPSSSEGAAVGVPDGIPDEVWGAIIADLAERLGAQGPEPTVVSAAATTWNDGSLGCPEAGQVYTQALVDGYQVVLDVDGEQFDYRVGRGTDVRLCEGIAIQGND